MTQTRRFILTGHGGFYNRGCEALVRATAAILRERFSAPEILLTSHDVENDRRHPAAEGIAVADPIVRRWSPEWFGWQMKKVLGQPISDLERLPRVLRRAMSSADALIQIGGDNFTSDYGLDVNSFLFQLNDIAFAHERPLVVWGASVGPFSDTKLEEKTLSHLRRAALVTVRESLTLEYLDEHGIAENVVSVADPAFLLEPDPVDLASFWPDAERVFAINVSALSCRRRRDGDLHFGQALVEAVIEEVLRRDEWGVLLVPHVMRPPTDDDHSYLGAIIEARERSERIRLLPPRFDARQTKHVISRCDALMAARTHATIAGFSTAVPTISLAYSRKAHGINLDLFGHDGWLLDIVKMEDTGEAVALVERLLGEREAVAEHLRSKLPEMKQAAARGGERLAELLGEGSS